MTQMEVYQMEGIKDLPVAVRVPFGKAWMAEHEGNESLALELLDSAVLAEQKKAEQVRAKK